MFTLTIVLLKDAIRSADESNVSLMDKIIIITKKDERHCVEIRSIDWTSIDTLIKYLMISFKVD